MARGYKTGGRDWRPGQSGNPAGRQKKRPFEIRLQRALFSAKWERLLYEFVLERTPRELEAVVSDPDRLTIERAIARYALECTARTSTFNSLLDRVLGKPSDGPRFAPARDVDEADVTEAERVVAGELDG